MKRVLVLEPTKGATTEVAVGPSCHRKGCHCYALQVLLQQTANGDKILVHEERS